MANNTCWMLKWLGIHSGCLNGSEDPLVILLNDLEYIMTITVQNIGSMWLFS